MRDKDKKPKWFDVRKTLPYVWSVEKDDPTKIRLELFEKDKEDELKYYIKPPLHVVGDGATVDSQKTRYFKLHPTIAKKAQLPELFESSPQYAQIFETVNNKETLIAYAEWFWTSFKDIAGASDWLNEMGAKLGKPHKLVTTVTGR